VSLLGDVAKWFGPEDAELVKKTLTRMDEQDKWNDVFSTKLIELLDNIDILKKEIRGASSRSNLLSRYSLTRPPERRNSTQNCRRRRRL
jgi:hypothetical protein